MIQNQHYIRAELIFDRAKGELDTDITGIVRELEQASGQLHVLASVLPGHTPLKAEQALVDAALKRAKRLTEEVEAALHTHVELVQRSKP